MFYRASIGAIAVAVVLATAMTGAHAFDESKYPNWKGQWIRANVNGQGNAWDPDKPVGLGQQAPLTPEYQKIFEQSLKDQANGQQGTDPSYRCVPAAMPRIMIAVQPMEIVITPETTYIMIELFNTLRRVYTDGRKWPDDVEPSFAGYSIGKWEDTDGDGKYDVLSIETRGIKTPHSYDSTGIPFHADGEAVIKERIYTPKDKPDLVYNEITTSDHALTRPWTVTRSYRHTTNGQPVWSEYYCSEDNHHVLIGTENYIVSGDGFLMPVRKGQKAPDLKYFDQN